MTTPSDYWNQTPHHTTVWDIEVQPAAVSSLPCKNEDACPITEADILREIREICSGLALSERARAARYDKIVEVLKMITKLLNEVNGLIATELSRANEQHPMFHSDHEAWAVTREEYMETEDALKQLEYELRYTDYMTRHDDTKDMVERVGKLRDCALHVACEAIQTAAMAEKWMESRRDKDVR